MAGLGVVGTPYGRKRRSDYAYERLRDEILSGAKAPGQHLGEVGAAKELGVATGTVRAALLMLEQDGLVVGQPRYGFSVRAWTPEEIEGVFDVRCALECEAARRAGKNLTPVAVERLQEMLVKRLLAERAGDEAGVNLLDFQFHMEIAQASRSAALIKEIERSRVLSFVILNHARFPGCASGEEPSSSSHEKLLECLVAGEMAAAAETMRQHIMSSLEKIRKVVGGENGGPRQPVGRDLREDQPRAHAAGSGQAERMGR